MTVIQTHIVCPASVCSSQQGHYQTTPIDLLSCVPANVYGYAALVGYTLSAGKLDALTAADNTNPLFLIVVSSILGAVLGYLMGQLSGVLKSSMVRRSA
jgi:Protein of unknown function (DUF1097)